MAASFQTFLEMALNLGHCSQKDFHLDFQRFPPQTTNTNNGNGRPFPGASREKRHEQKYSCESDLQNGEKKAVRQITVNTEQSIPFEKCI